MLEGMLNGLCKRSKVWLSLKAEANEEILTAEPPRNLRCGGGRGPLQLWLLAGCYRLRRVARSLSHRCCIVRMPYLVGQ